MDALTLYGFDARTPIGLPDPAWTAERRAQYLLRPEIERPLSVDPRVWPGALPAGLTDGAAPDYWADLAALRQECVARGLDEDAATLVALTVSGSNNQALALLVPCAPADIDPAWQPLGWDVADNGLVSGLSNCGYCPDVEDVEALRQAFGPRLNKHGLFDDLADAEAFRAISDARVPEHASFLIHRLFLVPW
jgi:hypothetical protein